MPRARRNSNTPDQEAARIFEARLRRHVRENPECQWELGWFRGTLTRNIRRSRAVIDQEVKRQAESGQPLCDKFMQELTKPYSHLDDEAQSPGSELFAPHLRDQDNERTLAGDASPEDNTPSDLFGDVPEAGASGSQNIPQIQIVGPQPSSESEGRPLTPAHSPKMQLDVKLPGAGPVKPEVKVEIPRERALPMTDPKVDHPVSTPSSTSTVDFESMHTPHDTLGPRPRAQPESLTPPHDPEPPLDSTAAKATQFSKEAGRLAHQFGTYGNIDDLDRAMESYGQAAELLAPSPEALDVSSYLNLGRIMRVKFEAFNDIKDLDSAFDDALVKAYEFLRPTPTNELYRDVLHELGAASLNRYLYDGTQAAGDEAQRYCELALNAEPSPSGPKRAETHIVLSRLHLARFEYHSRAGDAVSAVQSLDAASEADQALGGEGRYMENRARALFACYQTRRPEYDGYLNQALGLARQARNLTPIVTIQHPIASTLLADLLLARYDRSHNQPDLDEALQLLERAIRQVPYVRPEQPWIGERLARALVARFVNQRAREDIDDAISFLEIAVNLTVANPYRHRARLYIFGGALTLRFRFLALGEELNEDDRRELMAGIAADGYKHEQPASPPASRKPSIQEVTAAPTVQPEHAEMPQDQAEAPLQVKLEDPPSREPDPRPDLGALPESEQAPLQTQSKGEHIAPNSDPAPTAEQIRKLQMVEQDPVLDEDPLEDVAVTSALAAEPLVEPEQPVPEFDHAPSSDYLRIAAKNIFMRRSEPQLGILAKPDQVTPETQSPPSSDHVLAPSPTVESQLQVEEVPVVVSPAPESTSTEQETSSQLEPTKEPKQITHEVEPELLSLDTPPRALGEELAENDIWQLLAGVDSM
ncbi:hypothetical protein FRC06_004374 [Ceratobasidium sp. 370]|nr:hypothetical protein FRC06_004374 [Ceratobasidium sp. 370]